MGNSISNLINFETLKEMQKDGAIIIHTMDEDEKILIVGTIVAEKESEKIKTARAKGTRILSRSQFVAQYMV